MAKRAVKKSIKKENKKSVKNHWAYKPFVFSVVILAILNLCFLGYSFLSKKSMEVYSDTGELASFSMFSNDPLVSFAFGVGILIAGFYTAGFFIAIFIYLISPM